MKSDNYADAMISGRSEWTDLLAKVVADCRNPPNGLSPSEEDEVSLAAYFMVLGIDDCRFLDEHGGSEFFVNRYRWALSQADAYAGVMVRVLDQTDGRKKAVTGRKGRVTRGAVVTDSFRERLRDGLTTVEALSEFSSQIEELAMAGDLDFFSSRLPRVLSEMKRNASGFQRGPKQWIRRAWVPLALWKKKGDPQGAHDLILKAQGCMPRFRKSPQMTYTQFLEGWRKFRSCG